MLISMNWISDFVDLKGQNIEELIHRFTLSTAEVEEVCTWSVPGCKIAFAHELMENYFESKRVRKANEGRL